MIKPLSDLISNGERAKESAAYLRALNAAIESLNNIGWMCEEVTSPTYAIENLVDRHMPDVLGVAGELKIVRSLIFGEDLDYEVVAQAIETHQA